MSGTVTGEWVQQRECEMNPFQAMGISLAAVTLLLRLCMRMHAWTSVCIRVHVRVCVCVCVH